MRGQSSQNSFWSPYTLTFSFHIHIFLLSHIYILLSHRLHTVYIYDGKLLCKNNSCQFLFEKPCRHNSGRMRRNTFIFCELSFCFGLKRNASPFFFFFDRKYLEKDSSDYIALCSETVKVKL